MNAKVRMAHSDMAMDEDNKIRFSHLHLAATDGIVSSPSV
jgi:hypothetical protein